MVCWHVCAQPAAWPVMRAVLLLLPAGVVLLLTIWPAFQSKAAPAAG